MGFAIIAFTASQAFLFAPKGEGVRQQPAATPEKPLSNAQMHFACPLVKSKAKGAGYPRIDATNQEQLRINPLAPTAVWMPFS